MSENAYQRGQEMHRKGHSMHGNPFRNVNDGESYTLWMNGWKKSEKESVS